ncbi:MAG TPA: PP2C family serine/threonine-protein phosphatase [Blastocatellia bacterium]|nr:PP2C family serine/threonine-protein phosphatase [Blastocatellia bacterium]
MDVNGQTQPAQGEVELGAPPTPAWHVAAASACGASHARAGMPCQDAQQVKARADGTMVIAVADGAGSASLADVGAALAVNAAVAYLDGQAGTQAWADAAPDQGMCTEALKAACAAVEAAAACRQVAARELASTLILVVAMPRAAAAIQVGDGAVVIAAEQGQLIALTTPQSGEYINETTFLISPGAIETAQFRVYEGALTRLAVFTDGLQMLALRMPEAQPHAPFFLPLFRFAAAAHDRQAADAELAQFLASERVRARTDDDVTLVLAALADQADATA